MMYTPHTLLCHFLTRLLFDHHMQNYLNLISQVTAKSSLMMT